MMELTILVEVGDVFGYSLNCIRFLRELNVDTMIYRSYTCFFFGFFLIVRKTHLLEWDFFDVMVWYMI